MKTVEFVYTGIRKAANGELVHSIRTMPKGFGLSVNLLFEQSSESSMTYEIGRIYSCDNRKDYHIMQKDFDKATCRRTLKGCEEEVNKWRELEQKAQASTAIMPVALPVAPTPWPVEPAPVHINKEANHEA